MNRIIIDEQEFTVKDSTELIPNMQDWNQIQNKPNIKTRSVNYPKKLIELAYREFIEFCKELYINPNMYKFINITMKYDVWQVDFHPTDNNLDRCVSVFNIYLNSKNNKILQCQVEAS